MTLRVVPEGLTAASAAVEALTARMAAVHAAAAPLVTTVIPPAADAVSLQTATGLSAHGTEHQAVRMPVRVPHEAEGVRMECDRGRPEGHQAHRPEHGARLWIVRAHLGAARRNHLRAHPVLPHIRR